MNKAVRTARTGFTLIELLVVIAIIAILAAILFPVFAKAREKARQTSCLSQTKQIGLAILQYLDNYDEKLPYGTQVTAANVSAGTPQNIGEGWAGQIYSQVKSVNIFKCPDDPTTATAPAVPMSYSYNTNIAGITQAQFGNVAKSIMMCEVQGPTADPTIIGGVGAAAGDVNSPASDGTNIASAAGATTAYGYSSGAGTYVYATGPLNGSGSTGAATAGNSLSTGRHSDGSNFLLADGHSKWFRPAAVSGGLNNTTATNCGAYGTATPGNAAATDCTVAQLGATFSAN